MISTQDGGMSDRCALIVGGTSGIGLASAVALAKDGVNRLVLVGRDSQRGSTAREVVSQHGAEVKFVAGDAGNADQVSRIVAEASKFLGRVDILLNSVAPSGTLAPVEDLSLVDVERLLGNLALPPLYMTREVIPLMRASGAGSIINIASDAAKVATPGESVVGAAMAAIVMFSRTVAMEVKRYGIRVNALTPSLVTGTGTSDRIFAHEFSTKIFDKISAKASLGVPTAEDLAALVTFLAGPASAKITGQAISINGGISAG